MRYTGLIATIILLQFGCKPKQSTSSNEPEVPQESIELTWTEPRDTTSLLQIQKGDSINLKSHGDPYSILKAEVINHQLWLTVSYGGGCEEHQFEMYFDRTFKEELSLNKGKENRVELSLIHHGNNDRCRAIVQQNLRFNLRDLGLSENKDGLLKLSGWEKVLRYLP